MRYITLIIFCLSAILQVGCGGGDGGASGSLNDSIDGSGGSNDDSNSEASVGWSDPRIVATASSSGRISSYSIKSTPSGDALMAWITHRTDLASLPYDLSSVLYTNATSWGSVETANDIGNGFQFAGLNLLNSGLAIMSVGQPSIYTYMPSRGWVRDNLNGRCCGSVIQSNDNDRAIDFFAYSASNIIRRTYTQPGVIEEVLHDLPFGDEPADAVERKRLILKPLPDGSLYSLELVNISSSPDPYTISYKYSVLRESRSERANWSSWTTPEEIYRTPLLRSNSHFPISLDNTIISTSDQGNVIVGWEERYNKTIVDYSYRAVSIRLIERMWEEPQVIAESVPLGSVQNGVVSIDDTGRSIAVIPNSGNSSSTVLDAYTATPEGFWTSGIELSIYLDGKLVFQRDLKILTFSDGKWLLAGRVRYGAKSRLMVRWNVPGFGWTAPSLLHVDKSSHTNVDSFRMASGENGRAFVAVKQGQDYWVTSAIAP